MNAKTLLKTTAVTSIVAALLTVTTGCATTPGYNAYGDIYQDVYKDSDFYKKNKKAIKSIDKDLYRPAIEQTAANKVSSMGYRVKDVKYKKGDRTIKVKAERGREDYKIELGYPNYNVINIKKD
ncbi:hypothetical protein ES754_07825 [Psychrobacter frigidicola]|uniref:PepSY domain-containing protein n=1 Tax=Psychrobacter frigidicola TaxID=45611 RepID=A0A5C7A127_9GAMM|nr:hypothetical protein [Psychrobacter frigidicola]TXD96926.1 hypothetical protein ES754_07825 [Psychrobacter frigidicola]